MVHIVTDMTHHNGPPPPLLHPRTSVQYSPPHAQSGYPVAGKGPVLAACTDMVDLLHPCLATLTGALCIELEHSVAHNQVKPVRLVAL